MSWIHRHRRLSVHGAAKRSLAIQAEKKRIVAKDQAKAERKVLPKIANVQAEQEQRSLAQLAGLSTLGQVKGFAESFTEIQFKGEGIYTIYNDETRASIWKAIEVRMALMEEDSARLRAEFMEREGNATIAEIQTGQLATALAQIDSLSRLSQVNGLAESFKVEQFELNGEWCIYNDETRAAIWKAIEARRSALS
jgi:predicted Fe-S protein YdhL (DUF1289 family)